MLKKKQECQMEIFQDAVKGKKELQVALFGNTKMIEFRCKHCNKLLLKGNFLGFVEIVCTRCKNINIIDNKK